MFKFLRIVVKRYTATLQFEAAPVTGDFQMFRSDSTASGNVVRRFTPDGGGPSASPAHVKPRRLSFFERAAKRTLDIVGALVFFILFGPLYLFVALGVGISMGRPVHFWQTRLGEHGQRFRFYKFRSMVRNSDDVLDEFLSRNDMARTEWDTFQKLEKDPRITPIGQFIRKLSLDELPQFWNVLKGDMSLVGPRPALFNQHDLVALRTEAGVQALRPGLTGWAQVNGRDELPIPVKVALDAEYLQRRSLAFDLKILWMTLPGVVGSKGISH